MHLTRLKLAGFLAEAARVQSKSRQAVARKGTLFLFDEPTTGLHFDDIAKLMRALRKLIDAGHSLIVIEHDLDVIRASDWLIDLGPEGGDAGGLVVAEGTPEDVRQHATSHTGQALRVVGSDTRMAVVVSNNNTVKFHTYIPSDDSDGDGVNNTQDAFPLDRAASADTDRDGYPDAWNTGRTAADSTTGLALDAFPQDSACVNDRKYRHISTMQSESSITIMPPEPIIAPAAVSAS